jgi:predicted GH43/DUF377 family glycosyl hydrolase
MRSHAANPFALPRPDGSIRIYFSARDENNRSSIASLDYSLEARQIIGIAPEPVLTPGERGAFDDSGVSLGWIVQRGSALLLYYVGWNPGVTVPFRNSIGLAISEGGAIFRRHSRAPILDRNEHDPFSLSYPSVLQRSESDWLMWYGSNLDWESEGNAMRHEIKLATSRDGMRWQRRGTVCIGAQSAGETAFSRPSVLRDGERYAMWYSFRGEAYRIGFAGSDDGVHWKRDDEAGGLGPSGHGWDSDEVAYPHVFRHDGATYMLYCGNAYGRTGFGIAISSNAI